MWVTRPQPIVRRVLDLTGLLGVLTAPIDREQPLTGGSGYPSRTGPVPAVVPQPPDLLVAA